MSTATYVQRLRVTFSKTGPTRFISHLDIARTWERALNRAKIPVTYSQGFNPRPKMQFATATPLGMTSECELMDVWLDEALDTAVAHEMMMQRMAPGIEVLAVQ
ncbi:MAG: TIGR03936 family radical SAM-associated protein, partial [Anaerolineales bacterium]|nr:TIGR03936 family radical SAM-associated protein [Anaerolineales bacterium]